MKEKWNRCAEPDVPGVLITVSITVCTKNVWRIEKNLYSKNSVSYECILKIWIIREKFGKNRNFQNLLYFEEIIENKKHFYCHFFFSVYKKLLAGLLFQIRSLMCYFDYKLYFSDYKFNGIWNWLIKKNVRQSRNLT